MSEEDRKGDFIRTRHWAPTNQRNNNPHQIRIPIQTTALEQIRTLTPIPLQDAPQPRGHKRRIPIHQPRRTTQQLEIIREMVFPTVREVLVDRPCQEQDHDHGRGDPHGPVQVWVSFQHVEEVLARVDGCGAAAEDFVCVDVEGLRVEGEGPKVVFSSAVVGVGGGARAGEQEGGVVRLDFGGAGVVGGGVEV